VVIIRAPRGIVSSGMEAGRVPFSFSFTLPRASRYGRGMPSSSPSRPSASPVAVTTKLESKMPASAAHVRASSSAETSSSFRIADPEPRSRSGPNRLRASAIFSASSLANGFGS
jgi:hypothetical protein